MKHSLTLLTALRLAPLVSQAQVIPFPDGRLVIVFRNASPKAGKKMCGKK